MGSDSGVEHQRRERAPWIETTQELGAALVIGGVQGVNSRTGNGSGVFIFTAF